MWSALRPLRKKKNRLNTAAAVTHVVIEAIRKELSYCLNTAAAVTHVVFINYYKATCIGSQYRRSSNPCGITILLTPKIKCMSQYRRSSNPCGRLIIKSLKKQ